MSERPIRSAASVIVVREGPDGIGPEVLVLERAPENRFLAGYLVFPGGSVDAGDADLARSWFGDEGEAARAAAVRELAEETGFALTAQGLHLPGGEDAIASALAAIEAGPPHPSQLPESARWIAPEDVPVRFDARYYTVAAPGGIDPVPDGTEVSRGWWTAPRTLLDAWAEGAAKLYWPTWYTLDRLAAAIDDGGGDGLLNLRLATREPTEDEVATMPRSTFWDDEGDA